MSALRQWENMAPLGLHNGVTVDHVLGCVVCVCVGGGWGGGESQKTLSSPEESKALASTLMRVLKTHLFSTHY